MELKLNMPTRMMDLTPKQLVYVSRLFGMNYSQSEFLVKAFLYLSGLKVVTLYPDPRFPKSPARDKDKFIRFSHPSLNGTFVLIPEEIAELSHCCDFLLKGGEVNPVKRIGFAMPRHYRLYNATFEEYLMAENYYFAYVQTKDEAHLNNLISCLYRKPWQRWDASKIQRRALRFIMVDPAIKNTVFMWYIGFRSYVPVRCKNLFTGKKSSRAFNPRDYINGMIHQLNNGDITIKDKLLKQPVWDALDELEQRAIDHETANKNNHV